MGIQRCIVLVLLLVSFAAQATTSLLIPMDDAQKNHLKAYGITYYILKTGKTVDWLLNYRGGSFLFDYNTTLENECTVRGISYELLSAEKNKCYP